ncbi:MAG: hypothetical protein HUU15_07915, partial [Candidatus Brocadiae bacterium]|nr:hypothetical protein [Candidatus Brocadiia bacterium]
MGLIEHVHDLESPDVNDRFNAVTALWKLGPAAAPAVPKIAALLGDIDGVNVKTADGREVMITVAERASLALAAIGESAAGAVIEELKKDNAVSAIHCVRALTAPALARRAPVSVLGERLMRPKVSPAMSAALCDVLAAAMQSTDETHRNAARSALKMASVMGRVPAKHLATLAGTTTAAPAVRAAAGASAPV